MTDDRLARSARQSLADLRDLLGAMIRSTILIVAVIAPWVLRAALSAAPALAALDSWPRLARAYGGDLASGLLGGIVIMAVFLFVLSSAGRGLPNLAVAGAIIWVIGRIVEGIDPMIRPLLIVGLLTGLVITNQQQRTSHHGRKTE